MMNTSQHTPGPWEVYETDPYGFRFGHVQQKDGALLFQNLLHCSREEHQRERLANSRLVAAAPELYEALHRLLKAADDAVDSGAFSGRKGFKRIENEYLAAQEDAKAALSKARGE